MSKHTRLGLGCSVALLAVIGCSGIVIDRSMPAVEAGDLTLVLSACSGVPVGGFDACRVREGQKIDSYWRIFLPKRKKVILGGEINVYFKDIAKSYPITGNVVEIPWADFFSSDTWERSFDGTARALGLVRYRSADGLEEVIKVRGEARVLVLKEGYDPLPVGSGFEAFKTQCKIAYSTAGRSAVKCK